MRRANVELKSESPLGLLEKLTARTADILDHLGTAGAGDDRALGPRVAIVYLASLSDFFANLQTRRHLRFEILRPEAAESRAVCSCSPEDTGLEPEASGRSFKATPLVLGAHGCDALF